MSIKHISSEQLNLMKARENLLLAKKYLKMADKFKQEPDCRRGAIDIGYNAAELCVKGYLFLKLKRIPKTHAGIVQKFSQYYVKAGLLDKKVGRNLHHCLEYRNQARYVAEVRISQEMVDATLGLTENLIRLLSKRLEQR